jgi:hypothetical protein
MLLFIVKVWPTPYAPDYQADGSIDSFSRRVRVIDHVQKWNRQKGWVSWSEFYKFNVRPEVFNVRPEVESDRRNVP